MLLRTFSAIDSIESLNFYVSGTLISYSDKIRRVQGTASEFWRLVAGYSGWAMQICM